MRTMACVMAALALASCGRAPDSGSAPADVADGRPGEAPAPGVDVTAAPGVAFNYRYAFRLPPERISAAQERHAQACERLGIARCRITGMRYTLVGGDSIDAMLAFKLDPTIARAFGKNGIAAIEAADGMLIDAEITGTDAGAEIAKLEAGRGQIAEDRARIDRELAAPGLTAAARAELLRQRGELEGQTRSAASAVSEQRDSLASTPMTFDYKSGTAIRRFDPRSPFAEAADTAVASVQWTLAVVLGAIALLGPPALLVALLALLWFRLRRRFPHLGRRPAE